MIEPSRRSALAILAAVFGALVYWSFGKWTDPVIDFGFELYVPWRLTEGDVLYRDIAYRNGPFSSYWNAGLFALFGVSIRTLVAANLAVLAATTVLLFSLLERLTTRYAAMLATALFLTVCAFSQYGNVGNYNFVTPYQHGQTHGVALGLLVVAGLDRALRTRARGAWLATGIALGALLLSKAEVFAPALAASAVAIAFTAPGRRLGPAAMLVAGSVLLPVLALVALASAMPFADALHATAGNWPYLAGAIGGDAFYATGAGLDAPTANLRRMAVAGAVILAVAAATECAQRVGPRFGVGSGRASDRWLLALGPVAGIALAFAVDVPWEGAGRALPLAMLTAIAIFGRSAWHSGEPRAQLGVLFAVYALAMLGKLGLHPQFQHYGFALAAPAFALAAAGALGACRNIAGSALATAAFVALGASAWLDADRIYSAKTFELAGGLEPGDAILVAGPGSSPRGAAIERALRELDARFEHEAGSASGSLGAPDRDADATLLAMPEGAGLNYWLRSPIAGPYALFLPTELAAHGGADAMLERMRASPPDVVALIHRGHAEFGTGPFLADLANGAAFAPWLHGEYRPFATIGAEPFRGPRFGIVLLERNRGTAER